MNKRKAQSPIENQQKAQKQVSTKMATIEDVMKKLEKLNKLDSIERSVKEIETTCEDIKTRQTKTEKQTEENSTNIEVIQSDLDILQSEMNKIQYEKIRNNIIIHGVPRMEEEDTHGIALKICNSLLNAELNPNSLLTRRMPIRKFAPPIVIQFNDPIIKTTVLNNWKTLNNKNNSENINIQQKLHQLLNTNQNSKISLAEEQTQYSHKLLRETKEALGTKFKFIWIKFGNIYIRQSEDSNIHKSQNSNSKPSSTIYVPPRRRTN